MLHALLCKSEQSIPFSKVMPIPDKMDSLSWHIKAIDNWASIKDTEEICYIVKAKSRIGTESWPNISSCQARASIFIGRFRPQALATTSALR